MPLSGLNSAGDFCASGHALNSARDFCASGHACGKL